MSARPGIAPGAVVESDRIGERVSIGEFAIVREGVEIGDDVVVHPNAILADGVSVADGVEVFPGAVIGKKRTEVGALRRPASEVRRSIRIERGCSIGVQAILYYDVTVGPESLIGDRASIREGCQLGAGCVVGSNVILQYNVSVGDRGRIMGGAVIVGNGSIGRGAFVAPLVGTANDESFGRGPTDDDAIRGPIIEDDALVGVGAMLLPGVVIGRSAVVGAGAVVTRDVEPGTRVMGVPARPVPSEPGA